MIRHAVIALALCSLLPRPAAASDETNDTEVTSYRHITMSLDAMSLGLLVAGGFAEGEDGRDTTLSNTLFLGGYASASLATPIAHWSRGHRGRAVGSLLLRQGLGMAGMLIAVESQQGCDGFLCELDYIGYGMLGGLATAMLIDAAFMTEERVERPKRMWAPTVGASHQGAQVGVVAVF